MNTDLTDLTATAVIRQRAEATTEEMAEAVHQAYLDTCVRLGWSVKPENLVPYDDLSDDSKELDRASVRAVLAFFPLDRIKALEGVLMTARTALEQATKVIRVSDGEGHWVHVYKCCRQSFDHGHASDCKRQQALAEIDGVTGAETAEVQP